MEKSDAARFTQDVARTYQHWYRRYLTGWTSDYLSFRASPGRWKLGRPAAACDCGPLATMAGPVQ